MSESDYDDDSTYAFSSSSYTTLEEYAEELSDFNLSSLSSLLILRAEELGRNFISDLNKAIYHYIYEGDSYIGIRDEFDDEYQAELDPIVNSYFIKDSHEDGPVTFKRIAAAFSAQTAFNIKMDPLYFIDDLIYEEGIDVDFPACMTFLAFSTLIPKGEPIYEDLIYAHKYFCYIFDFLRLIQTRNTEPQNIYKLNTAWEVIHYSGELDNNSRKAQIDLLFGENWSTSEWVKKYAELGQNYVTRVVTEDIIKDYEELDDYNAEFIEDEESGSGEESEYEDEEYYDIYEEEGDEHEDD